MKIIKCFLEVNEINVQRCISLQTLFYDVTKCKYLMVCTVSPFCIHACSCLSLTSIPVSILLRSILHKILLGIKRCVIPHQLSQFLRWCQCQYTCWYLDRIVVILYTVLSSPIAAACYASLANSFTKALFSMRALLVN